MRLRFAWILFGTITLTSAAVSAQPGPPPPPPGGVPAPPNAQQGAPSGQVIPGQPPLQTPPMPGQPMPGQPMPGQPMPGQPMPGQPMPGQPMPGQPMPGQPTPGQPPSQMPPGPPQQPQPNAASGQNQWLPPPQPQMPWMAPSIPPEDEIPGTKNGIPLLRRGRIAIETSGFTDLSGNNSILALGLDVHMPVARRTFIDARLPIAYIFPGNIMLGASHVSKLGTTGFLTWGGQLGLPLLTSNRGVDFRDFSLPNGTWNIHEYTPDFLPIKLSAGYERFMGQSFTFRLDLEPIISIPIGDRGFNSGFTLQHAVELQYGHSIGGGLRVQGVAITEDLLDDAYQLSVEPFFVVRRDLGFARLGLLLPIDDSAAGPAFDRAWGLRIGAGLHID